MRSIITVFLLALASSIATAGLKFGSASADFVAHPGDHHFYRPNTPATSFAK